MTHPMAEHEGDFIPASTELDDIEWDLLRETWWQRLRRRWQMWREKRQCDGCSGRFSLGKLGTVSGDYWLCEWCAHRWYRVPILFNKYMMWCMRHRAGGCTDAELLKKRRQLRRAVLKAEYLVKRRN